MKYYEIHDPYYALIRAHNKKEAFEIYNGQVYGASDDEERKAIYFELVNVPEWYAAIKLARSKDDGTGELIEINEAIGIMTNKNNSEVLILDKSLL